MVAFSIDRGGTFTDIYALYAEKVYTHKLLSNDPHNYADAPSEGIRRLLETILKRSIAPGQIDPAWITWVRMGTTVATNALLERKGARCALVITQGFGDALKIGYQNRPELFNLAIERPEQLYETVVEIDERVVLKGGEAVVEKALDVRAVREQLGNLKAQGITSLAVVLMHAYRFACHERQIEAIAEDLGFSQISISCEVIPSIKLVDRGDTTVVDAYLTPHIQAYIHAFQQAFASPLPSRKLLFMQSHGGLCEAGQFRGANALLSGPAGGIYGYAQSWGGQKPLIGFDMGGTSTDVSRYDGAFALSYENEIEGIRIKTPQIEILTTAAGGGSRLFYKNSLFVVGPESSGAHPGPVCYKKGGYLSITDANLVLGRLQGDFFPKIFGAGQDEALGLDAARAAFAKLAETINRDLGNGALSVEEVALGFIDVANEHMIKPIKEISVQCGYDIREHTLCAFGGAGGQHACAVAGKLGIKEIIIHRHAGILSAVGLSRAEISKRLVKTLGVKLEALNRGTLDSAIAKLEEEASEALQPRPEERVVVRAFVHLGYENVEHTFAVPVDAPSLRAAFEVEHLRLFGFLMTEKQITASEVSVEVAIESRAPSVTEEDPTSQPSPSLPDADAIREVFFQKGWLATPFYYLESLPPHARFYGPAVIVSESGTVVADPGSLVYVDGRRNLRIELEKSVDAKYTRDYDPVLLSIFNNLFMSTAEQMGKMFQKTSVSTNIKERLDFSCALFDGSGNLIANAPHIPVHLGSMSHAVKHVLSAFPGSMQGGESFITNAPYEGGSHLPDITVITPYMVEGKVAFVVANRGHHADIGGKSAGSMPPFSTTLAEEGALIEAMKIVENGEFAEAPIRAILQQAGARRIEENLSDIRAALSANHKGIALMKEIWQKYTREVCDAYMGYIRQVSARAVRELLEEKLTGVLEAEDFLDDGSKIAVRIFKEGQQTVFDFTGSEIQSYTNQNTPFSVTASAVVYVLRALLGEDLPLNQGFLEPVVIKIGENSLLNPGPDAAVVGGNVTTSQRIVDVLLRALGGCAASQGCMNNFSFGDQSFGYYETIGGGSGAGEGFAGADGVHTHMTNTRMTDAEVLESRYPVIVRKFSIRKDSGGAGRFKGGDGIVREIEFQKDMQATLLTERRVFSPWGVEGGEAGARGHNILIRDGRPQRLPSKVSLAVKKGECIRICTPGGGGYGMPEA